MPKLPKSDLRERKPKKPTGRVKSYEKYISSLKLFICFYNYYSKIIDYYQINLLAWELEIKWTKQLIAQNYFRLIVYQDVQAYIKHSYICLTSKIVCYNLWKISCFC